MSTVEKIEKNMVSFEFSVTAEEFEAAIEKAYKKNVGKISIQGFRKGKAPRKLIEKYYGVEIFYEDAINIVLPDAYDKAIDENNIYPVDQPEIDIKGEISRENGVTFTNCGSNKAVSVALNEIYENKVTFKEYDENKNNNFYVFKDDVTEE